MGNYENNLNATGPNSLIGGTYPVTTVWIGDSITYGYNPSTSDDVTQSYPYLVQSWLNAKEGDVGQGLYMNGGNFSPTRYTTTGTVTNSNLGPLHNDLVLASGASVTVQATNINTVVFFYQRQTTGGTVTVTNTAGTYGTQSTAGAVANDVQSSYMYAPAGTPTTQSITLSCAGGPCEITGLIGTTTYVSATNTPWFFEMQAQNGYSTADFITTEVLNSINSQVLYRGNGGFYNFILALGTNDIYSPTKAVSSATFKSNLITIINGLEANLGRPILTVPLRVKQSGGFSPVLEPFDNYRQVIYQLAREYSLPVIDLSELDMTPAYQDDGVHPNKFGYQMLADFWYRKLNLASLRVNAGVTSVGAAGQVLMIGSTPGSLAASRITDNGAIVTVNGQLGITSNGYDVPSSLGIGQSGTVSYLDATGSTNSGASTDFGGIVIRGNNSDSSSQIAYLTFAGGASVGAGAGIASFFSDIKTGGNFWVNGHISIPYSVLGYQGPAAGYITGSISGSVTLVSGTATVSTTAACAVGTSCNYSLTNCSKNASAGIGTLSVGTISAGTSFVINSLSPVAAVLTTDASTVCWQIN